MLLNYGKECKHLRGLRMKCMNKDGQVRLTGLTVGEIKGDRRLSTKLTKQRKP